MVVDILYIVVVIEYIVVNSQKHFEMRVLFQFDT